MAPPQDILLSFKRGRNDACVAQFRRWLDKKWTWFDSELKYSAKYFRDLTVPRNVCPNNLTLTNNLFTAMQFSPQMQLLFARSTESSGPWWDACLAPQNRTSTWVYPCSWCVKKLWCWLRKVNFSLHDFGTDQNLQCQAKTCVHSHTTSARRKVGSK